MTPQEAIEVLRQFGEQANGFTLAAARNFDEALRVLAEAVAKPPE